VRLPRRATAKGPARAARAGFTLAEVMVTIVIVGVALVLVLQGLNATKFEAAHTRNLKFARELGLLTLGQIEAGPFQEDSDRERLLGTYAEQGHEYFAYEVVFGDDGFLTEDELYRYDPRPDQRVGRNTRLMEMNDDAGAGCVQLASDRCAEALGAASDEHAAAGEGQVHLDEVQAVRRRRGCSVKIPDLVRAVAAGGFAA